MKAQGGFATKGGVTRHTFLVYFEVPLDASDAPLEADDMDTPKMLVVGVYGCRHPPRRICGANGGLLRGMKDETGSTKSRLVASRPCR